MGLISPTRETASQPRGGEELDVSNVLTALLNLVNGNLDSANLAAGGVAAADLAAGAKNLFPQLASAADRKINFGSASSSGFAGGKHRSETIAHGLGRVPVYIGITAGAIATFSGTATPSAVTASFDGTVDGSTFGVRLSIVDGFSNNAVGFYWVAIG